MTAKDLKASILQLAIQGKLVAQDPRDEPASALLARVRGEGEVVRQETGDASGDQRTKRPHVSRLTSSSPRVSRLKSRVLPPIADDEKPFDLPEGWAWCRLGEVASVYNGDRGKNYPSKAKLCSTGEIPFISALNMVDGTVPKDDNLLYLSAQQYEALNAGKLQQGDLVVCIRGSLGKHCIYPYRKGAIASSLVILRSPESELYSYLDRYIDSPFFTSEIQRFDNGTAQPNLAARDLSHFVIPLPPLAEQKRIVAKIEELMPMVERYGAVKEQSDALEAALPDAFRKSVLQYAIQGKLVPQDPNDEPASALLERVKGEGEVVRQETGDASGDQKTKRSHVSRLASSSSRVSRLKSHVLPPVSNDEQLFDLPEGWAWVRWGDLSESIQYGYNAPAKSAGRIKMVRISDVQDGNVLWERVPFCDIPEDEIDQYLLKPGDILFARTGGTVGKSYIEVIAKPRR